MGKADYHHGDLRQAVLDAAERALQADPRETPSIRALAQDLGVSATAPHAHFKTKADLLTALATEGFERLGASTRAAITRAAITRSANASQALEALAAAYLAFSAAHAGLYRVMFTTGVDLDGGGALDVASSAAYGVLADAVQKAYPSLGAQEVADLTLAAWAIVHGFASLLSEGRVTSNICRDPSAAGLARLAADLIAARGAALMRGQGAM